MCCLCPESYKWVAWTAQACENLKYFPTLTCTTSQYEWGELACKREEKYTFKEMLADCIYLGKMVGCWEIKQETFKSNFWSKKPAQKYSEVRHNPWHFQVILVNQKFYGLKEGKVGRGVHPFLLTCKLWEMFQFPMVIRRSNTMTCEGSFW